MMNGLYLGKSAELRRQIVSGPKLLMSLNNIAVLPEKQSAEGFISVWERQSATLFLVLF